MDVRKSDREPKGIRERVTAMRFRIKEMPRVLRSFTLVRIRSKPWQTELVANPLPVSSVGQKADHRRRGVAGQNRSENVLVNSCQPMTSKQMPGRVDRNDRVIIVEAVFRPYSRQRRSGCQNCDPVIDRIHRCA